MDIRVQNGENLSLAIKKALVNEGAKQESFSGSVWNRILDLVDQQNEENKTNGGEALYQGGSTRTPANWKKNYKVVANQILKFSEKTWNGIRNIVGLGVKDEQKSSQVAPENITPELLQPSGASLLPKVDFETLKVPEFGIETPDAGNGVPKPSTENETNTKETTSSVLFNSASSPVKKTIATNPDTMPPLLQPEEASDQVPEMPDAEPIADIPQPDVKEESVKSDVKTADAEQKTETKADEQVKKQEQPVAQKKKEQKVKAKKQKPSKPVVETKTNSDGSITTTKTTTNTDGSSVKEEETKRTITTPGGQQKIKTETVKTSTSADGKTVSVETSVHLHKDGEFSYDSLGSKKITTTENNDGTKTISFEISPGGNQYMEDEVLRGTYSIDNDGNAFAQLADGGKISINTKTNPRAWGQETEIKLTDKNGNEVTIPLKVNKGCNSMEKLSSFTDEEKTQILIGGLTSAISGLSTDTLDDLKAEVKNIKLEESVLTFSGEKDGCYNQNDTMTISSNAGLKSHVLTHEIGHALDNNDALEYQTDESKGKFDKLIKLIKDKGISKDAYAITNPKEFFAEYYATKEGYGFDATKELLQKLETSQDPDVKSAYTEVKAICDGIIEETRSKKSEARINKDLDTERQTKQKQEHVLSDVIRDNKAKIEEIFGEKFSYDSDFIALYYLNQKTITKEDKQFLDKIYWRLPEDMVTAKI